jgi:S-(hydroxymethyl)glutathione dehydrogenase/alcohol dehydrogenase
VKAAVLREVGKPLAIENIDIDKPGPREVLIRTKATGVCHSDLHFVEGLWPSRLPLLLGHESAGVVEAVGSQVQYVQPGDHVITCLSVFCGHCDYCLEGRPALCGGRETMRQKGEPPRISAGGAPIFQFAHLGGFAEQLLVHEHAVVKVRKDVPLDRAALIGCSVTTGVGSVLRTARVEAGETVAVIGCGGIGLSTVNGAAIAGAGRVIAIDRLASKLELAKKFGATDLVDASKVDVVKTVKDLTGGGVHHAFEAIGLKLAAEQAWQMLRPGGTATVIGMIPFGQNIELHGADFLQEKRIQGSTMGSNRFRTDMPRLVDFYLAGKLKLDEMVSHRIGLDDVNDALAALKTGEVARQVIVFD